MSHKTIVIASKNENKIREIKQIFSDFEVLSLKDVEQKLNKEITFIEDKDTYSENALAKVRAVFKEVNQDYICIADDSGLAIDALNGFPGVLTARWMKASDKDKNLKIIDKVSKLNNRACHYTTVIALKTSATEQTYIHTLDGVIADSPRGENGFGFDEIFELPTGLTLSELSTKEKLEISPRTSCLEDIKKYLVSIK